MVIAIPPGPHNETSPHMVPSFSKVTVCVSFSHVVVSGMKAFVKMVLVGLLSLRVPITNALVAYFYFLLFYINQLRHFSCKPSSKQ